MLPASVASGEMAERPTTSTPVRSHAASNADTYPVPTGDRSWMTTAECSSRWWRCSASTMGFGNYDHAALKGGYLVLRQWKDGKTVQL